MLGYIVASKLVAVGLLPVALVITALDAALPSLVRVVCCLERHHNVVTHDLSVMNKVRKKGFHLRNKWFSPSGGRGGDDCWGGGVGAK